MNAPPGWILAPSLLPAPERLIAIGINAGLTLLSAFVLQRVWFAVVGRITRIITRAGQGTRAATKRAHTFGQILRSSGTLVITAVALVTLLEVLGWDVKPLLAGVGILGVALSFGAQTLVRDLIAGVFILIENQYSVGDVVEVNGKPATVEEFTVRKTVLRDANGYVHFVPNGEMRVVTNRSRDWNALDVDLVVANDEDPDRSLAVCRTTIDAFNADPAWRERVTEPVQILGFEAIGALEARIRLMVRALPGPAAAEVGRELRRRLQRAVVDSHLRTVPNRS